MPRPADAPTYRRIADDLRGRIIGGSYPHGQMLPSLADLMTIYATSITPVRMAIDTLRHEGLVTSQHGKGSFVAHPEHARLEALEQAVKRQAAQIAELRAQLDRSEPPADR